MTRAVFIGRFQPFHQGHYKVIEENIDRFDEFVIAVGSAEKKDERENPLSFEEREDIIRACFSDVELIPVEDETKDEEGNKKWIQKIVEKTDPEVVISQNELVQRLVREYTEAKIFEQEMYDRDIYVGTEIRRRIRSGEEWRYLVPDCAAEKIADYVDDIKEAGIQYEFEPGWKKENAYHDTYEK